MAQVIVGADPHKRSATIEVIGQRERVLGAGRFGADRDGYQAMLAAGRKYIDRVWAVEGCNGIGRHVAQRLVADGETVLDVPAKLSARARGQWHWPPVGDGERSRRKLARGRARGPHRKIALDGECLTCVGAGT
jgi:hypothetical protein